MLNKVQLIGHVGQTPEVKNFTAEKKVAKFSLATSETFMKNNEKTTETQWHNCTAWGKTAELIEKFVPKGKLIYVSGKLKYSQSEKDGVKKYFTEIIVDEVLFLSKNETQQTSQTSEHPKVNNTPNIPTEPFIKPESDNKEPDDLPF